MVLKSRKVQSFNIYYQLISEKWKHYRENEWILFKNVEEQRREMEQIVNTNTLKNKIKKNKDNLKKIPRKTMTIHAHEQEKQVKMLKNALMNELYNYTSEYQLWSNSWISCQRSGRKQPASSAWKQYVLPIYRM